MFSEAGVAIWVFSGWSGHVRRGFGGADDVAKRLVANVVDSV
jgi:hypothetical protein